jgi:tRNA(fMet)-specific endonuclease VapC
MGILIDASVLIGVERGRVNVEAHIAHRRQEEFYVSVITASELLHGVWRAQTDVIRNRRAAFVESILQQFPILPIDLVTARVHAQLWANMATTGKTIGSHDLWLAAACIANGHSLVTSNVREFVRVPGLSVEDWTKPLP